MGKTNVLLSLIADKNGLEFENIYLYCKTLDQDKYKYLAEVLKPIKDLGFYTFTLLIRKCAEYQSNKEEFINNF